VLAAGAAGIYLKYRDARAQEGLATTRAADLGDALKREGERVAERDAALKTAGERANDLTYQLGVRDMVLAHNAHERWSPSLAREFLERVPAGQRGFEWHYLARQARGGLFTVDGQGRPAFSPDGKRLVTGAWNPWSGHTGDNAAKVWDARTG